MKIKYLAILIMVLAFSAASCDVSKKPAEVTPEPDTEVVEANEQVWLVDFDMAAAEAQKKDLPILINFSGSDWCSWCIKLMDEVFSQKEFLDYAKENLVLLNLDFPRRTKLPQEQAEKNQELMQMFGIQGFPTVIVLSSQGEILGRTGYQYGGPQKYVEHIQEFLNK
ncbi:MAG: thioredoxin family protein [Candidatus Cloacimonetes bacterium]|nr:thioredoxin family protein [Candidatus Cloacimonadota bacterium]